jgi:hypothetical protein
MVYYDVPEQEFILEFELRGPRYRKLVWRSYKIVSKFCNGREHMDTISLEDRKFPRLVFSPVRSYHFESNSPL